MSELTSRTPETVEAGWHRLSARMLLIHPISEFGRMLPLLVGLVVAGSSGDGQGLWWGLAGTAIVLVHGVSRWFTTRLRVTPEQVQLRQGLLQRSTVTTPTDRVRTVDLTSHLLHRALGLTRVVIGTGTSDRHGSDLVLDALSVDDAERLRADLLHKQPVEPAAVPLGAAPAPLEQELVRLDPAWVRYAPFTLSGALTGLVVYSFAMRLQNESHVNVLQSGPLRSAGDALRRGSLVVDAAVLLFAAVAFVAIASTVGYVLAFWDFRLVRHSGGSLRVSRGLITTRATSIERRRLVGVEVSDALTLRAVGAARCLAIATGLRAGGETERGVEVLLPPAPRAVAMRVATAVLDGAPALTAPLVAHGPQAWRRRYLRAVGGAVVLGGGFGGLSVLAGFGLTLSALIALTLVALSFPLAADRYRTLGHALAHGCVVTRSGSLVRRHSAVACHAVIGWNLRSTLFQRRAGLTTLTATTAAGRQGYRISDVDATEAVRFAEAAVPGLLGQFRA